MNEWINGKDSMRFSGWTKLHRLIDSRTEFGVALGARKKDSRRTSTIAKIKTAGPVVIMAVQRKTETVWLPLSRFPVISHFVSIVRPATFLSQLLEQSGLFMQKEKKNQSKLLVQFPTRTSNLYCVCNSGCYSMSFESLWVVAEA